MTKPSSHALPHCETLLLAQSGGCLTIMFNRPEQRNAMNTQMSAELNAVIDQLAHNERIRTVIFRGAGGNFCAGGDIKERREQIAEIAPACNPVYLRNRSAGQMFKKIAHLPQTTLAFVEGAAMGGGFGFACIADMTLVAASAKLGMPETTLGVAPAQIAPYVVRRIGLTKARQLALTGQRINGEEACQLGLAQYVFRDLEDGERQLAALVKKIDGCGPKANAVTKEIMNAVSSLTEDELIEFSAARFAALNEAEEGREGQRAFVEKRAPQWPSLHGTEEFQKTKS